VTLTLEYEPEGLVEKAGDFLNIVERRAEADMENFRKLIENGGREPGGWRGAINPDAGLEPGVEAAAGSHGDSGKSGVSGKVVAAGVAAAAAAAAAGVAATRSGDSGDDTQQVSDVDTTDVGTTEVVETDVVVTETVVDAPQTYPVADDPAPFNEGIGDDPTIGDNRSV
jgi:hypothetical protein